MNTSILNFPITLALPQRWKHALPALFMSLAWIIFICRDAAMAMLAIWSRSETYMHGFLVMPIVLWLVWRKRLSIAAQTPDPSFLVLPIAAVAGFLWAVGELVTANSLTQFAFVALLVLSVPCVLGTSIARLIMFPLGFMFFSVPIGDFLLPQLMEWTANFTVSALRLSGVPVYREGLNFVIPSGNWSVVEACSGVRYMIASLTVGSLFAYMNYQSTKRRAAFVLVSMLVPVVANWIRAYMIVMLGHLSGNKLATGVDHLIYGWVFFGVVILLMFFVGIRWSESETGMALRSSKVKGTKEAVSVGRLWGATASLALLAAAPHVALWAVKPAIDVNTARLTVPTVIGSNWIATLPPAFDFKPAYRNASAEFNSSYVSEGKAVGLYLGYYQHQGDGRKLVGSDNVPLASQDRHWAPVSHRDKDVFFGDAVHTVHIAELRGTALTESDQDAHLLVWQTYWINGILTKSEHLAKLYSAIHRLIGKSGDSVVIAVYAFKGKDGEGEVALASFLLSSYGAINASLMNVDQKE